MADIEKDAWIVLYHKCPNCFATWNEDDSESESMEEVEHYTYCPECGFSDGELTDDELGKKRNAEESNPQ